jgi:hypothetical protein
LCRRHGQAIPPHGEDKCAPQPEEIDCFYAGDKQQLWWQKSLASNSYAGKQEQLAVSKWQLAQLKLAPTFPANC